MLTVWNSIGGNPTGIERIMASDAFLNSIEINFKKATQYIQKIYGSEILSEDLSNQINLTLRLMEHYYIKNLMID